MGVMKVTDSDGNVGYLETTIDLTSTSAGSPARVVQNREIVTGGNTVSTDHPFAVTITNWNSGAPVAGPGSSTTGAVPKFADGGGHTLADSSLLIDATTGVLADVPFVGTLRNVPSSTVSLSSNQNDYNPGTGMILTINATSSFSITGFTGGQDGKFLLVRNVSSNSSTVTLSNNSSSSQAANRIQCPNSSLVISAGASVLLVYDNPNTCWRVTAGNFHNCDTTYSRNATFARHMALSQTAQSQITSNQDNYGPNNAPWWQLNSDAARNITGMSSTAVGSIRVLDNTGSYVLSLLHESSSSTAANRFKFPDSADFALVPGQRVIFGYDGTASRWVPVGSHRTNLGAFTVANLPAIGTNGKGFTALATNGRKSGESSSNGTGCPVWYDGTDWKTFYDNSTVAA